MGQHILKMKKLIILLWMLPLICMAQFNPYVHQAYTTNPVAAVDSRVSGLATTAASALNAASGVVTDNASGLVLSGTWLGTSSQATTANFATSANNANNALLLQGLSTNNILANAASANTNTVNAISGVIGTNGNPLTMQFTAGGTSAITTVANAAIGASGAVTNGQNNVNLYGAIGGDGTTLSNLFSLSEPFDAVAALPVPQLIISTYFYDATSHEYEVSNLVSQYNSSGVNAAWGGGMWINLQGWTATNRDANGNITWDTNNFPDGMPWLINYCHTNGFKVEMYVNHLVNSSPFPPYLSSATNKFNDVVTILKWGADGLDDEETGSAPSGDISDYVGNHTYNWVFTNNYNFERWQLLSTLRAIEYCRNLTNTSYNAAGEWTNGYANTLISRNPVELLFGGQYSWLYNRANANRFYMQSIGAQVVIDGGYYNFAVSVAANTMFGSLVDTATNFLPSPGHYVNGVQCFFNQEGHPDFFTNLLTATCMMTWTPTGNQLASTNGYIATALKNPLIISIYKDPLVNPAVLWTNVPSGEAVLQVRTKRLVNGKYALWLWNRSTNTTTIAPVNLRSAFGLAADYNFQDVWYNTTTASTNGLLSVSVPPFGMKLYYFDSTTPNKYSGDGSGLKNVQGIALPTYAPINDGLVFDVTAGASSNSAPTIVSHTTNLQSATPNPTYVYLTNTLYGNAIYIKGTADTIIPQGVGFSTNNSIYNANAMSLNFWFRNPVNANNRFGFFQTDSSGNILSDYFDIRLNGGNGVNYFVVNGAATTQFAKNIYDGQLHMFTGTYNSVSSNSVFYIDGVPVISAIETTGPILGMNTNSLAMVSDGTAGYWIESQIWNRALSTNEVYNLAQQTLGLNLTNTGNYAGTFSGTVIGAPGTTPAAFGTLGEYTNKSVATGSSQAMQTSVQTNLVTLSFSPGSWLIWGVADYTFGTITSTTELKQGISLTSGTIGGQDTFSSFPYAAMIPTAANDASYTTPALVFNFNVTTNVYLVGFGAFTASTLKGYGTIYGERIR